MVRLLASTTEYSDFLGMSEDSKNGISFAPRRDRKKGLSSGYGPKGAQPVKLKSKHYKKVGQEVVVALPGRKTADLRV